jgi:hypothetical protein
MKLKPSVDKLGALMIACAPVQHHIEIASNHENISS